MHLDNSILRDLLSRSLDDKEIDDLLHDYHKNRSIYADQAKENNEESLLLQHLEFNYTNPFYSPIDSERVSLIIKALRVHLGIQAEFSFQAEDQDSFSLIHLARRYSELSKAENSISVSRELRLLLGNLSLRTIRRPLLILKRLSLRRGKLLKEMLDDPISAEMWYSIEYVSPIHNRFLFKLPYRRQLRGDTDIVDLVFFAMQTGDEYLDGVVDDMREAGRLDELADTLKRNPKAWEFTLDEKERIRVSEDLNQEVGEEIRQGISHKYSKSYEQLYERLVLTIHDINYRLANKPDKVEKAEAICDYFNFCLSTAKDDIYFIHRYGKTPVPLGYLRWHFHKKNNLVMIRWIELRALFLDLPLVDESGKYEWGSFLHSAQLFDDLRDVKIDHGLQPNIIHSLAFYHYREEWDWFMKNQQELSVHLPLSQMLDVNFNMCRSVLHCMTFARAEGLKNMAWLTIKGAHLHWKWHWMSSSSKYKEGANMKFLLKDYFKSLRHATGSYVIDIAAESIQRLQGLMEDEELNIQIRSGYLFDILMYDSRFQKEVRRMASRRERYLLRMNGFFSSPELKTSLLKAVLIKNGIHEVLREKNSLFSSPQLKFLDKMIGH